jgi:hypothetical protein
MPSGVLPLGMVILDHDSGSMPLEPQQASVSMHPLLPAPAGRVEVRPFQVSAVKERAQAAAHRPPL